MKKLWYALQNDSCDSWDNGTFDREEAMKMLYDNDEYNMIAVIDDDDNFCIDVIYKDFDIDH